LDEFGLIKYEYILIDRNGDKMVIIEDGSKWRQSRFFPI
jgi:hypothetical protein